MSSIRERLLGKSKRNSSIRDRLELNSSYYKQEYNDQLSKRNNIQKDIQKNTYEKGVQTTVTPFSTQRNILPIQEQTEITKNKKFEVTAGQDKLGQNKSIENKYQEIKKSNEYKNQMKQLEEQSNEVGYAKYNYDKQRIAEDDIGWYDKSIGRLAGGIGSLFDYNGGLIKNENGDLEYLPTFNQMKHQKVKENYKTGIGRFVGDVLYESGKIAGSTLINQALPGVGSTMYFGKMFVDSTNQAVSDGYDTSSATMYGLVNVGLEYGVGKMLGSATKGLTGGKNGDYEELLKKTFTNITKKPKIANILANAGSEATEEFVQEYLDNISKLLILDKNTNIKDYASVFLDGDVLSDALYSAAIGGVTGGIIGTATGKDTNVENKDVNLYKTFKEELEETKKNTTNKETINKIDTIISNINSNINNNSNVNTNADTITSQINEYETLKEQNKLTSEQEIELNELKNQLNAIQNQNTGTSTSIKEEANLPTVQDIVNQEKLSQSGINLPVYNQQSNINNSDKAILPTVNDFNNSNINIPTSDIKVDMTKITPEILNDIKGFKLGDPSIESYKGSYIKTMLNEVGIKVPTAMNYVSEVRPDMSFTTTKDLTRQQYASIGNALQKLRSVDITGINNINGVAVSNNTLSMDVSQINQTKGNIPINQELLNKYANVKEIFMNERNNYDGNVKINNEIVELSNFDINKINIGDLKKLANDIFIKYNQKNTFENAGNKIVVNKSGINESIEKIYNNRTQRSLIKEHLQVFSDLGDIIENATLVNQTRETKNRENINYWNYYFDGLEINNELYYLEFDVRSMENGENQYRVQRLEKKMKKTGDYDGDISNKTNILPPYSQPAFSANNISQSNQNVKSDILPTINNMQIDKENTNKFLNPNEISKLTKEDANTTPILPKRGSINKVNDGNSHFAKNIKDKVNMLNVEQKAEILSKEDVRYYDKVTNKESLEKAFKKINDGGESETFNWLGKKEGFTDIDVAEGWILLKQYQDRIQNTTDLVTKDNLNKSMVEVAKKMRKIGTTAGQTVQAFNIMERMTPEGMVYYAQSELSEAYDRMVKNKSKEWIDKYRKDFDLKPDEVQFIMDTMQEVQNMEDGYDKRVKLAEIQKLMTDKLPPEKGAKIRSWMRISMLFNPKTQVRNVAGNALIMPVNSFGDLFSSYADKLIAKKTGVRTTGTTNVKAMLKGIKKGAYEATNDYKKGINTKDMEGNRFEISDGKSFSEKNLMGRTLNRTESLLNYVMDAGDRVFSEAAFENSLQNQLALNNTTEITQEMIDIAHQEALSRTWNDNNNYTRFVLNARAGLNKFVNFRGYGLGDVLIPFAKTPANLTKAIVDYSPAGLVSTINKGINLKRSLTNGQYTATMQHEFVQSLGKATAGTMLYILGIALAKAGITSGDSDDDKDTANFLKNTLGISSYSIKIGDKSFTYDWAQPLAAPLSITANVVNSKKNGTQALLEGIIGSLDTAGSILLEQSFLQSINDVLNDNDGVVSGIINEILELPARAVPTFSKQIADLVDGTQRTSFEYGKPIQSAVNSIKAKIPFASKTLNPAVDTMGREIQKYGGKNNIFNVFLNPANVSTENISESAEEIYRLYKETGETDVMPRVAPYYINQKGEKIMMTGKDRVEYQKISGEIIEDNIKKLINNASYSSMSDSDKANVVKDIVNYSYNIAKKDVLGLELSDKYQKAYEYSEIGDIGDYYTFKESIDNTDKDTKKSSITKFLIDSDLNNEQLAYLYGNYYSSDKVLNALVQSNIPIKEYIKFNSETFESDYYTNGKTVPNSRKNKVIKYINSLNLSIPQKAMLIKMEYSSFKQYDNQIVKYVNNIDCSSYDKKVILKTIGFTSYDKDIINTINSKNISIEEKTKELEELGFKVRNGRVYTK